MNGYSFCIITNGARPDKLAHLIQSIYEQMMPAGTYEIVIAGRLPKGVDPVNWTFIPSDGAERGLLGLLRNTAARAAKYDHLIVTDDDVYFHRDFYPGLVAYGEDYDILLPRLLNPDGSRLFDWCTFGGPTGHHMRDYSEPDDGYTVPTGGVIILKREVWERVKWSETMGFYEGIGEDYDYGQRLHAAGYVLKSNPASTVTHDDPTYYSPDGLIVLRKSA